MRTTILSLVLVTIAAPVSAARVEKTVPADRDARIDITNLAGEVTVTGWDRSEVTVEGEVANSVEEVVVDSTGRHVTIEVVVPSGRRNRNDHATAILTVRVPTAAQVDVSTVSARIYGSGLTGGVEAASVSGDIAIGDGATTVKAESVSGSVGVGRCSGRVEAASVSGRVSVAGATGRIEASTVSGNVEVRGADLSSVALEAVSGSLFFSGALSPRGRLEAGSHTGDVILELDSTANVTVEANTFSGRIANALGSPARRSGHGLGSELAFRLGNGSGRVVVETFSGDVTIRPRER